MNYRHAYHAGSFSDVLKHFVLMLIIQELQQKKPGFCYIDTHAGTGCYDLSSALAQKTLESDSGIKLLWNKSGLTGAIQDYLNLVQRFSKEHSSHSEMITYPGSPCIARALLRPQDRIILNELHPEEAITLRKFFRGDAQVHIHSHNAYFWLKGMIPPAERRGLVLIDPPYEREDEYQELLKLLLMSAERWPTGIYALWYPITPDQKLEAFSRSLKKSGLRNVLNIQLSLADPDSPSGIIGSGLVIINPPWQLESKLNESLKILWSALSLKKQGAYQITQWLPQ